MSSRASLSPARCEVDGELDVDLERLRPRLLLGQHAVHPELAQSLDDDGAHGQLRAAPVAVGELDDALLDRDRDDLACHRAELAAGDLLDDDDRVRPLVDEPGVEQVAGEHAEQAVAELLVVDEHVLLRDREPRRRACA